MPKDSNSTKRYGPNNLTRTGMKKPRIPKKWFGRSFMGQYAKVLERLDETVRVFEIREEIRAQKRDKEKRPHYKFIRDDREARENYSEHYRQLAAKRKRDAHGRFLKQ